MYLAQFMEGVRLQILMWHASKRFCPILSVKGAMLGRYYDMITPYMTGGKPYQMYYLRSRGFKASEVAGIPLSDLLALKLGGVLFAAIIFLSCSHFFAEVDLGIAALNAMEGTSIQFSMVLVWGSLALGIAICAAVLLVSLNKTVTVAAMRGLVGFCHKIRLVKNKDATIQKTEKMLSEYRDTMRALIKRPLVLLGVFGAFCVTHLFYALMIYFVCLSVGITGVYFLYVLFAVEVLEFMAATLPMPGGTGMVEPAFQAIMISVFVGMMLGSMEILAALIIWKIISYMLPIANGLGITLYDGIWGNAKNSRKQVAASQNE
jgi:uncharacterized protein (TIRG00374 family)